MWFEIIGWIGTFLIVAAYFLVSTKKIGSQSNLYQLFNLLGAIGIFVNVFRKGAWPAVALQVIWGIIAIISLFKNRHRSHE
jgi:hypothetical protein